MTESNDFGSTARRDGGAVYSARKASEMRHILSRAIDTKEES